MTTRSTTEQKDCIIKNTSDIEIKRVYTKEDLEGRNLETDLASPGEFPYTRGVQPTMYRSRFWTMRQYAGFASAEESNNRYKYLLQQGQTGLSIAFDLPTQIGYDSDHSLSQGEVGKVGVAFGAAAVVVLAVIGFLVRRHRRLG